MRRSICRSTCDTTTPTREALSPSGRGRSFQPERGSSMSESISGAEPLSRLPHAAGYTKPHTAKTGVSMFNWFQALLPRTGDFFGMFERHAATLVAAADALRTVRQTFLTPFDRGSITSLIGKMDDAIDEMQDTARAIALYELTTFEPEMKRMVKIIVEAADLTQQAIPMLRDISRNCTKIHALTEQIVHLESDADVVHAAGLKKAFQQHSGTPMQFMVAREIYKHLERITDAFEDVANEIDGIVIDHA